MTGLSELPLASFMLGASLNGPFELLQAIYGLGGGQIPPIRTSTHLLQVGRQSKRTLPTSTCSYILGGGTNGLYKVLQVSYTLGGGQNGLFKIPQASYALDGGQEPTVRTSTKLLRAGRRSKVTRPYFC